jgi:hypothetical protein
VNSLVPSIKEFMTRVGSQYELCSSISGVQSMLSLKLVTRCLAVRAVNMPIARPVQMSGRTISAAPMVLIDILTKDGIGGSSSLLC